MLKIGRDKKHRMHFTRTYLLRIVACNSQHVSSQLIAAISMFTWILSNHPSQCLTNYGPEAIGNWPTIWSSHLANWHYH